MFRLQNLSRPGRHAHRIAVALLAGALALLVAPSAAVAAPDTAADGAMSDSAAHEATHEAALAEYERNHWAAAYEMLAMLADRGHAEAARMALQMRRYGPVLYGQPFAASGGQVERWSRLSGCAGELGGLGCRVASQAR